MFMLNVGPVHKPAETDEHCVEHFVSRWKGKLMATLS